MKLHEQILSTYFEAQRGLVDVEQVDERNVLLSLPLHFSAYTRVELTVTKISDNYFAISDMAQTLGELKDAGYGIGPRLKEKILSLAKMAQLEFAGNHLTRKCSADQLGEAIHQFAEAAKTIGDAYLTYRGRPQKEEEDELIGRVRKTFRERKYDFSEKREIIGRIEKHEVNFFVAPNGSRGLALAVITNPTHIVAEAWGFKTRDIKDANKDLAVGVVYDSGRAKEVSKTILEKMADIPIPSTVVEGLGDILERSGIRPHKRT